MQLFLELSFSLFFCRTLLTIAWLLKRISVVSTMCEVMGFYGTCCGARWPYRVRCFDCIRACPVRSHLSLRVRCRGQRLRGSLGALSVCPLFILTREPNSAASGFSSSILHSYNWLSVIEVIERLCCDFLGAKSLHFFLIPVPRTIRRSTRSVLLRKSRLRFP